MWERRADRRGAAPGKSRTSDCEKWVVPDSDVELVAYQVEHLPDFYRLADSESGEEYWPKQAKVNYYIRMIDQELSEGFQKEWIENYLEKLKERIAEGDLPKI